MVVNYRISYLITSIITVTIITERGVTLQGKIASYLSLTLQINNIFNL